ncbi:MAG: preprotein translocase subunit SecG [Treponema sp.]|jgi:preprotein translocase subunit SecG|nr:preprotein translocase subunit SecG [Treponema sp.]
MTIIGPVLLVFFVIIAVLLILLVLVQNEEGDSLGGIFAGGSGSAFGSRSGNVLTRATTVLGALFLVLSLGLALLNRGPGDSGVEAAGRRQSAGAAESNWVDEELESRNNPADQVSIEAPAGTDTGIIETETDTIETDADIETDTGAAVSQ